MTRAIILAAGQGTRLRPLTDDKPKCLVDLKGVSLLERQVHTLKNAGITRIRVVTGYCADKISDMGFATSFNRRYAETNMVESLFAALDFIEESDGDLIISYGDIVYQQENLSAILESNEEISIMVDLGWRDLWELRQENPMDDAETLVLDQDSYIIELGKKPNSFEQIQGQYTGLFKISGNKLKELVEFYKNMDREKLYDGQIFDKMYMTSFLQNLIDAGWRAKAVLVKNGWLEVDSVRDLTIYEDLAKQGKLDPFYILEEL